MQTNSHCDRRRMFHEKIFSHPEVKAKMSSDKAYCFEMYTAIQNDGSNRETVMNYLLCTHCPSVDLRPVRFQKDYELMLLAVRTNGMYLGYIRSNLKRNRSIVEAAVHQNGRALQYAPKEFANSKSIVLTALSGQLRNSTDGLREPCPLAHTSEELRCDREVILASLKYCGGHTLKYAHEIIANDFELALQLVSGDGCLLQHVSLELKKNSELVFAAVKQNGHALQYADEIFRRNRVLVLEVVKLSFLCLVHLCDDLKADRDIMMEAVQSYGGSLLFASEELRNDRKVVSEAVKQCGWALAFASEELKNDYEVVMLSTSVMYGSLYYFASPNLRDGGLVDYVYWLHSKYRMMVDDFLASFVFGFAAVNKGCQLGLLNRLGEEALKYFQLQVAEYAGVQVGKRWNIINNASKRLMLQLCEVKQTTDLVDERTSLQNMTGFLTKMVEQEALYLNQDQKELSNRLWSFLQTQIFMKKNRWDWNNSE